MTAVEWDKELKHNFFMVPENQATYLHEIVADLAAAEKRVEESEMALSNMAAQLQIATSNRDAITKCLEKAEAEWQDKRTRYDHIITERDRLREELADYKAYYDALHRGDSDEACIIAERIEARKEAVDGDKDERGKR